MSLLVITSNFLGCGGKQEVTDVAEDKKSYYRSSKYTFPIVDLRKDVISFSSTFGELVSVQNSNMYRFKIKQKFLKEKGEKAKDIIMEGFFEYCKYNNGKFKLDNDKLQETYLSILINGLIKRNIPEAYINEYLQKTAEIDLNAVKLARHLDIGADFDLFCYFPHENKFFYLFLGNKEFYVYKNNLAVVLPQITRKEINKVVYNLKRKIDRDLENKVWISLNLPLYYRGVKLYYFKAEPLNKRNIYNNEIWNVVFKLKNETSKPFVFNISKITLIKEGKEYKPLFHIDGKGKILDAKFRGDCRYIGNNKLVIEPDGICEIYFKKYRSVGGLRFIGVKDLKGAILLLDKYPVYIWSMTKYDMKIKNLAEGFKD